MIKESVRQIPFFTKLSDEELDEIVEIGQVKSVSKDQLIFEEGDPGDYMCVIIEGQMRVFHRAAEAEIPLSTLEKGAFFGEMALIDGAPRSAGVRALMSCTLFVLGREDFLKLIARSAHIGFHVMRGLSAKIRALGQGFVVTWLQNRHIEDQAEIDRHRAVSQMVAGVAHEINTPIGIASQGANFIAETLTPAWIEKLAVASEASETLRDVVDAAQLVEANVQRADKLIKSFLKLSVRQISDSLGKVDLRELADETVLLYPARIKGSNLTIEVDDALGEERVWVGYPAYLTQVLLNLILNAQAHAYPSGSPGSVKISLRANHEDYILTVKDFGRGIGEEELKQVFTAFYTTNRAQGGTGLGLAIVHNLVTNALQGAIGMESTLGLGTSVTVRVPKRLREKALISDQ